MHIRQVIAQFCSNYLFIFFFHGIFLLRPIFIPFLDNFYNSNLNWFSSINLACWNYFPVISVFANLHYEAMYSGVKNMQFFATSIILSLRILAVSLTRQIFPPSCRWYNPRFASRWLSPKTCSRSVTWFRLSIARTGYISRDSRYGCRRRWHPSGRRRTMT